MGARAKKPIPPAPITTRANACSDSLAPRQRPVSVPSASRQRVAVECESRRPRRRTGVELSCRGRQGGRGEGHN
eukprot:1181749-Prorocentrum_minimum.AAC.2